MKKQTPILIYLGAWRRAACWCGLVVGLMFVARAAMAELTPITLMHDHHVEAVAFSPDGTLLATGSRDKTAKVWAPNTDNTPALIENAVNLRGYSVDLEYPSALELLDVQQGDLLKEGWQHTTQSTNTVRFSASKAKGEFVEGSGEIATLSFRIWEGGEHPFTLDGTLAAPVVTDIYTPELEDSAITVAASPNWEVNKDYVVDIQDIVILGINFDKEITANPRPNPDVTRDGLVDLFDLVAVASHSTYVGAGEIPAPFFTTKRIPKPS